MRNLVLAIAAGSVAAVLSAAHASDTLAGSKWNMARGDAPTDTRSITFEADGNAFGDAGCNRFFGSYETSADGGLSFGRLGATKMLCPQAQMRQEREWFSMLDEARGYRIADDQLMLVNGDDEVLVTLFRHAGD